MNREKNSPPHTTEASTEINSANVSEGDEDDDEDDDDWDTFQSFPASTREAITNNVAESEDSEFLGSSSPSVSMEDSISLSIDELKIENKEHGKTSEEVSMSISPTGQRSPDGDLNSDKSRIQGVSDRESGHVDIQEHDTEIEALPGQEQSQVTEQVSSQLQVTFLEDHKPVDESPENKTDRKP